MRGRVNSEKHSVLVSHGQTAQAIKDVKDVARVLHSVPATAAAFGVAPRARYGTQGRL